MSAKDVKLYEVAKSRFKSQYAEENPKPPQPNHDNFWSNWQVWYTIVLVVSSFFLSALRTGSVFASHSNIVEGILGVIVVEGVALGIPFFLVLESYHNHNKVPGELRGWMIFLAFISVSLGLLANAYSAVDADALLPDSVNYGFLVFVGAIATVTVATTGHIMGVLWVRDLLDYDNAMQSFRDELQTWTDTMNGVWLKQQNKWYRMVAASVDSSQASRQTVVNPAYSANPTQAQTYAQASADRPIDRQQTRPMGFSQTARQTDAVQIVMDHLDQYPDDVNLSSRKLADAIGNVGKDSANNAKKEWLARNSE